MSLSPETVRYLRPVLNWLEAGAPHETPAGVLTFNMAFFRESDPSQWKIPNHCGTVCCIAGATQQFNKIEIPNKLSANNQCYALGKAIGLTDEQTADLFIPEHKPLAQITPDEAAATLRRFIETGEIKWEI